MLPAQFLGRHKSVFVCLLVVFISALYLYAKLGQQWVPYDEGILAHSAERILQGQTPHRDYTEPYTGGLAYLDAAVFWILGRNLMSLRYVLFVFFLAWVPVVFIIARRYCAPWSAAGVTLLAVIWSVPTYPAAMPSWYCLFFNTFGLFAVLKYTDTQRPTLLFLAGALGGLSVLMKSPGLLFVAAQLLFFVYREQDVSRQAALENNRTRNSGLTSYFWFVFLSLMAFSIAVLKTIMVTGGQAEFFQFVVPSLAIVLLLLAREHVRANSESSRRFRTLFAMVVPFLAGVVSPLAVFGLWFWHKSALGALFHSLAVLQLHRVTQASQSPMGVITAIPAVVLALALTERPRKSAPGIAMAKTLLTLGYLYACFHMPLAFLSVPVALYCAIPVMTLIGLFVLKGSASHPARQETFALLCVTVMWSLVQFPFFAPVYFSYVAPIFVLTLISLLSFVRVPPRLNWTLVLVFFSLFGIFLLRRMNFPGRPSERTAPLNIARAAGLRVREADARTYTELIPFIRAHAPNRRILAGTDCPEIYFLSGLPNPTRALFEFLEEPGRYESDVKSVLQRGDLDLVVVHQASEYSKSERNTLTNLVIHTFPASRSMGDFIVYYRE